MPMRHDTANPVDDRFSFTKDRLLDGAAYPLASFRHAFHELAPIQFTRFNARVQFRGETEGYPWNMLSALHSVNQQ